jgi:hypothetical protein
MHHPAVRFAVVLTAAASLSLAPANAAAQAPAPAPAPTLPTNWFGLGFTSLSFDGGSSSGYNLTGGVAFKKIYFNVATNIFSEAGSTTANNDYQLGYLFMHRQTPGSKGGQTAMGITGGLWHPQEGDMSPLAAFNMIGALGKTSRLVGHVMGGLIFPEGGDQVMAFRVSIGMTF